MRKLSISLSVLPELVIRMMSGDMQPWWLFFNERMFSIEHICTKIFAYRNATDSKSPMYKYPKFGFIHSDD